MTKRITTSNLIKNSFNRGKKAEICVTTQGEVLLELFVKNLHKYIHKRHIIKYRWKDGFNL
jgi:hypothetical protein